MIKELNNNKIRYLLLISVFCLVVAIFGIGIKKGMPPGGDASVYIMDTYTVINNNFNFPKDNNIPYLGRSMYESPFPTINLLLMHNITGLNIEYPLFTLFQFYIFLMIFLLTYLIMFKLDGLIAGILSLLFLLNFQGIYFLFNSSTLANFLATVFVLLFLILWLCKKNNYLYAFFPIIIINLYLTHRSLSFVFFVLVGFVFILLNIKKILQYFKQNHLKKLLIFSIILLFILVIVFIIKLWPIIKYNFFEANYIKQPGNFREKITWSQYLININQINLIFLLGFFALFLLKYKKDNNYIQRYIIIWIILGILFSLSSYIGIYFYSYRFFYLTWPFISILTVIGLIFFLRNIITNKIQKLVITSTLLIIIITSGVMNNLYIFSRTNFVTKNQVRGLEYIKNNTSYGDTVLTNSNDMYPFFIAIMSRMMIEQNISDQTLRNFKLIKDNNIKFLTITSGDKFGVELNNYKKIIQKLDTLYKLEYENNDILVYKVELKK